MYNGMNVRLERRMSSGIAFLLNYTLSHGMDSVGGPNSSNGGIVDTVSTGGHAAQSVYPIAPYGISPIDQTASPDGLLRCSSCRSAKAGGGFPAARVSVRNS